MRPLSLRSVHDPPMGEPSLTGIARRRGTGPMLRGPSAHGLGLPETPEAAPYARSACKRRPPVQALVGRPRGRNLVAGVGQVNIARRRVNRSRRRVRSPTNTGAASEIYPLDRRAG